MRQFTCVSSLEELLLSLIKTLCAYYDIDWAHLYAS